MNVRLSILLVLVLVLIGGSVAITQSLKTKERTPQQPWLFKVNVEDITQISVTHLGQRMEYALQGDDWVIKDGNDTPVFHDKWAGTTLLLSGPRVSRDTEITIEDAAKYGLESPQTKVRIVDRSGHPIEFHLGNATPDGRDWYAKLADSDRLFTVADIWGEVISKLATEPPYEPTPTPPPPTPEAATATPQTGDR